MPLKADTIWNAVCPDTALEAGSLDTAVREVEGRAVGTAPILFPKPADDTS
jgi:hypothetical protein